MVVVAGTSDVDVEVLVEVVVVVVDELVVGRTVEVELDVELAVEVLVVVEVVVDVVPLGGRPRPRFAWISASPALRPVDLVTRNVIELTVRPPIDTEIGAPSRASGPVSIDWPPSSRSRRPFVTLSVGFGRS